MKANFKEPRYVLPLIALPFLFVFFYLYKTSFGKEEAEQKASGQLRDDVAEVSDQVKNASLSDKLEAYREHYKDGDGYTAVGGIGEEQTTALDAPEIYNQNEKKLLDSIERSMKLKYGNPVSAGIGQTSDFPQVRRNVQAKQIYEDREWLKAMANHNEATHSDSYEEYEEEELPNESDPLELFRQQMALIDSMGKAADPEYKAEIARQRQAEAAEVLVKNQKRLPVSKSLSLGSVFNTVSANEEESFIRAIVDQNITGYAGSRLRIRLLDDLFAGKFLIRKGTYLYAHISGFTGQRVNLSVASILQGNQILPVRLDVYDNDGSPGLFVPASAFREFSKELGMNTSQGMNLQQAESNNQLVMGLVQKMFQSTSTAVSRLIRQNKAKLKYSTLVYLIDPEKLKNKQSNY